MGAASTVKLFNVNDGAVLRTFKHHTEGVCSLALLPDGLRFVSGSGDKTVKLFNVNDGTVLRTITHGKHVECLALLHDGLRFVKGEIGNQSEGASTEDKAARIVYHGLAPR